MDILEISRLLAREYGRPEWRSRRDPISELVAVILSQNTSDVNSHRAFENLSGTFGAWERVATANPEEIERVIRSGGLSRVKAGRIKKILQTILTERGRLDLSFLEAMPLEEAKAWLRRLPGVGPKTVGCVLLFALGRPAMPVDTHVYRVARRLGLIATRVSVERAHEILEAMVPPEEVYAFHINMVTHGRRVCRAQRPACPRCVLRELCSSAGLQPGDPDGA